jgi:CBS domain-containing protein
MMRVAELMSRGVHTIEESASCLDAVARMCQARVRHLPVVSGAGQLVGIVTDRDLRHHLFAAPVYPRIGHIPVESLLREAPVREVMSTPVVAIAPDADVGRAADLMRQRRVGALPVVEAGRVVGIVTEIDVLRHIVGSDVPFGPECDVVVSFP